MSLTPAELESRKGMAFQVTPEWRLSQMFDQVFVDEAPTMRKTGDFIKAVMQDIIKEESNVIADAGYTMKDINADVVMYVKHYLTNRIREAMNE
jgi:L-fucose isomerase-like protein